MGETPAFMRKGDFFQNMDKLSQDASTRSDFLAALKDTDAWPDYVALLCHCGVVQSKSSHEAHLRKHWFPGNPYAPDAWWQESQPIEPILRQGYARAFEEADKREFRIDGYWVSTGTRVAVGIGVNEPEGKVTLIRITPPCPSYKPDTSLIAVVEFKGAIAPGGIIETTTVVGPKPVETSWTQTVRESRLG
jgi:hypothetical protein